MAVGFVCSEKLVRLIKQSEFLRRVPSSFSNKLNIEVQRFLPSGCQMKQNVMGSLLTGFVMIVLGVFSFACKKGIAGNESALFGTWVKGSNTGDTLWFMKKNGKYIMRQPESFNPLMPVYAEKEYQFKDGKLKIKSFAPTSQEYFPINSFSWTNTGEEFTITNSELFVFMSSIVTYKYKKI